MNKKNLTYKKSGVNITAADNFIKFISLLNTKDNEILGSVEMIDKIISSN